MGFHVRVRWPIRTHQRMARSRNPNDHSNKPLRSISSYSTVNQEARRNPEPCSINGNRTGTGHDAKLARESLKRFRNRQRDCRNPAAQRRLFPQFGGKQGADRLAHGHARPRST